MLKVVSYLAPNMFPVYQAVGAYLAQCLGTTMTLAQGEYDPMDDPALQAETVDLAFMCGLPFARREHDHPGRLIPLAAPVMLAPRYADRAVYYSDVIVRADSPYQHFADLSGARLCYNDAGSNSGYNVLRHFLLARGYPPPFFRAVLASGAHQRSVQMILADEADCAAIDSTVLERALQLTPEIAPRLRVIEVLGPFPMPPIVASRSLGQATLEGCRRALLDMPHDQASAALLGAGGLARFAPVEREDYEPLRLMEQAAHQAGRAVIR